MKLSTYRCWMIVRFAALGFGLCGVVGGCGNQSLLQGGEMNLLLVSIDTCRADHTSPYGREIDTLTIQRLADEGYVFEEAVTCAPLTQPAHTSLFTGWYPGRHGVRDNANYALSGEAVTLAEILKDRGYQTGGVVASMIMSKRTGLDQGFETYNDAFSNDEIQRLGPTVNRTANVVRDLALKWIDDRDTKRPFALFLHYYDPHLPYTPPVEITKEYPNRLYDGEIIYVDRCLAPVLARLEELGLYENTLVVLLGDHGESLWEHKEQSHGLFLYDTTIRIPLIVRVPGRTEQGGTRISTPVSIIDVMPSTLELLGIDTAALTASSKLPELDGLSFAPLLEAKSIPPRDLYAETLYPLFFNWSPSYSIRRGGLKYIRSPEREFFNTDRDPHERKNLISEKQPLAERLAPLLEEKVVDWSHEQPTAEIRITLESAEALASLGYTGGVISDVSATEDLPDTKSRTEIYHLIDRALSLMATRNLNAAEKILKQVVELDPANPSPHLNLGDILGYQGKYEEAEKYLRICLDLSPTNTMAHLSLGNLLSAVERFDEAETVFDEILDAMPKNAEALFGKAQLYEKWGDRKTALRLYKETQRLMPNMPGLQDSLQRIEGAG